MTREQLIQEAREFAEESGFSGQALPIVLEVMADFAAKQLERAETALREIEKGEGPYSQNPQTHLENILDNLTGIARDYFNEDEKKVLSDGS